MNVLISRLLPFLLLRLPLALLVMAIGFVVTSIAGLFLSAFTRRAIMKARPDPRGAGPSPRREPSRPERTRPEAPNPAPQQDLPWKPEEVEDARFEEIQ